MNKLKLSLFIMLLVLSSFVFIQQVSADGMIYVEPDDPDMYWGLITEYQQLAAINYENGFENMLISVDLPKDVDGEKAVWIFPIPSTPDRVVIDVLKGYPTLDGDDIDREYEDTLNNVGLVMVGYSTFPLCVPIVVESFSASTGATVRDDLDPMEYVIIHERIEKMGLTTELITTRDQASLSQYIQSKGLKLPPNSQNILDEYIGQNYSFVVSYINNLTQFRREAQTNKTHERYRNGVPLRYWLGIQDRNRSETPVGVFVKFPTKEIYFPLKLTSVYGNKSIPLLIYVVGHVTPKLYSGIESAQVTYYSYDHWYYEPPDELRSFFNGKDRIDNLNYTKIKLIVPSKHLTEDLWIKNSAPLSVPIKMFLASNPWLWGIILFVILSMLSSLLAGIISFRKNPLPRKKLMLYGLWNCLTFIGFLIAVIFMKTRPIDPKLRAQLKSQGLNVSPRDRRKILYIFLFYVFFIALVTASLLLIFIF